MAKPLKRGRIEISSGLPGWKVPSRALRRVLERFVDLAGFPGASLGVRVCSAAESRRLNRRYMGRGGAADILSFPALGDRPRKGFEGYLGDLMLCVPEVERRFPRFAPSLGKESAFLLLHGVMHLCGRHHETPAQEARLWKAQKALFRRAGKAVEELRMERRRKNAF